MFSEILIKINLRHEESKFSQREFIRKYCFQFSFIVILLYHIFEHPSLPSYVSDIGWILWLLLDIPQGDLFSICETFLGQTSKTFLAKETLTEKEKSLCNLINNIVDLCIISGSIFTNSFWETLDSSCLRFLFRFPEDVFRNSN